MDFVQIAFDDDDGVVWFDVCVLIFCRYTIQVVWNFVLFIGYEA